MSPKECIQMATVLQAHAVEILKPYLPDSPELLKAIAGDLQDLPRRLEEAFLECDVINELARETARNRRAIRIGQWFRCRAAIHHNTIPDAYEQTARQSHINDMVV